MEIMVGSEDKYSESAVKCAAETLLKAEEIKKDAKLLALVKGEMEKSASAIKSIAELRKIASKKQAEPEAEKEDMADSESPDEELDVKPELMTEEDKAGAQKIEKYKKRAEKFKLSK